jgi:hypothetical protein
MAISTVASVCSQPEPSTVTESQLNRGDGVGLGLCDRGRGRREESRRAAGENGVGLDAAVGDARNLDLQDASVDALLLLRPLYHLTDADSRRRCWEEATRVVRSGGLVVAAAISRRSVLLDGALRLRLVETNPAFRATWHQALDDGVLRPLEAGGFSGYSHRPDELSAEAVAAGMQVRTLVAVEEPGAYLPDLSERWRIQRREQSCSPPNAAALTCPSCSASARTSCSSQTDRERLAGHPVCRPQRALLCDGHERRLPAAGCSCVPCGGVRRRRL